MFMVFASLQNALYTRQAAVACSEACMFPESSFKFEPGESGPTHRPFGSSSHRCGSVRDNSRHDFMRVIVGSSHLDGFRARSVVLVISITFVPPLRTDWTDSRLLTSIEPEARNAFCRLPTTRAAWNLL